eukprot:COSAG04_NODE_23553_length_336_cov_0.907173_1_plen_56_part_10
MGALGTVPVKMALLPLLLAALACRSAPAGPTPSGSASAASLGILNATASCAGVDGS